MKPWTKTMDTLSEKWNIRLTYFIRINERVLLFSQQYCKISRNQNRAWQYLKVTSIYMNYSYPPISFFSLTLSVRGILKKCTVSPIFASVRCTCTFKKVYDSMLSFRPNTNEHVPEQIVADQSDDGRNQSVVRGPSSSSTRSPRCSEEWSTGKYWIWVWHIPIPFLLLK